MIRSVYMLHEYGAPEHYQGLTQIALENGLKLERREFGFIRQFAKGILKRDVRLVLRAASNGLWILASWLGFIRNQRIVLGIAPFDWKILFIYPIICKNAIFWHTSWPYWDGLEGKHYPKPLKWAVVKRAWRNFIDSKLQGIFFVTKYAQNNFQSSFGVSLPSWVVYHSYDPEVFFAKNRNPQKGCTVGFVGRLEYAKGINQIISLSKINFDYPIKFVIIGKGPMQGDVEAAANESNGCIEYLGFFSRDKLGVLYRNIDFLLVPSIRTDVWEEAFGMAIIEAMACGVVPIATNHPGPTEILTGDLAANVFPENRFQEGVVAILNKATGDPAYLDKLREEAMQLAQSYSVASIAKRWSSIIQ